MSDEEYLPHEDSSIFRVEQVLKYSEKGTAYSMLGSSEAGGIPQRKRKFKDYAEMTTDPARKELRGGGKTTKTDSTGKPASTTKKATGTKSATTKLRSQSMGQ